MFAIAAIIVVSANGEVLLRQIISDLWEFEIEEVSIVICSYTDDRLIYWAHQTSVHVGIPCIADMQHAHWITFDFKRLDVLDGFRTQYNDGLDLAEAHRMRQELRIDMITDVVLAAHSRKVRSFPGGANGSTNSPSPRTP